MVRRGGRAAGASERRQRRRKKRDEQHRQLHSRFRKQVCLSLSAVVSWRRPRPLLWAAPAAATLRWLRGCPLDHGDRCGTGLRRAQHHGSASAPSFSASPACAAPRTLHPAATAGRDFITYFMQQRICTPPLFSRVDALCAHVRCAALLACMRAALLLRERGQRKTPGAGRGLRRVRRHVRGPVRRPAAGPRPPPAHPRAALSFVGPAGLPLFALCTQVSAQLPGHLTVGLVHTTNLRQKQR